MNGVGDIPAEDINGDLTVDVNDCTGAQGPQGPQGPTGPPGPGTLMAWNQTDIISTIGTGDGDCDNYLEVTIDVPSAGTIVVTGMLRTIVSHSDGTTDVMIGFLGGTPANCPFPYVWLWEIPATWPTDTGIENAGSVQQAFSVPAGGSYTYFLNGSMWLGWDANDRFISANLVAVFYPS